MKLKTTYWFIIVWSACLMLLLNACTDSKSKEDQPKMTQVEGPLSLGIDESIAPMFEQVVKVYDSSFPKVEVSVNYGYENELINQLMNDQLKVIVMTRDVTEEELEYAKNNRFRIKTMAVAADGIAVIGHPKNSDSLFRVSQIKSILEQSFSRTYKVAIPSVKGSVVSYINDHISAMNNWGSLIYEQENYEQVMQFVQQHEQSIGFLPINFIYPEESNEQDPSFREDLWVIPIYNDSLYKETLPYQAYLALNEYPLTRKIYFVNRDNRQVPSTGFSNFLTSEPAQLLFKKGMFVPLKNPLVIRPVEIKQ